MDDRLYNDLRFITMYGFAIFLILLLTLFTQKCYEVT